LKFTLRVMEIYKDKLRVNVKFKVRVNYKDKLRVNVKFKVRVNVRVK